MRVVWFVIALAIVTACSAVIVAGIVHTEGQTPSLGSYRFRLTVTVEADGQTRAGSSVIDIANVSQRRLSPETPQLVSRIIGDAVFVDLGKNRNLLALLTMTHTQGGVDPFTTLAPRVFDFPPYGSIPPRIPLGSSRNLTGSDIPLLVTFDDLSTPTSLRVVSPKDFESVFGPDVRLQSVTMELTDAPVTRGIGQHLSWLDALRKRGGTLDGSRSVSTNDPLGNIGALSFSR